MKVRTLLCAENIITDAQTNQILIYNLINEISSEGFPLLIAKFTIYYLVDKEEIDEESSDLDLTMLNNATEIFSGKVKIAFNGKTRHRGIIRFNGIVVNTSGTLYLKLQKDAVLIAETSIDLVASQNNFIVQNIPELI